MLQVCHPLPVNALIEKMEMLVRCFLTVAAPYPLSAFLAMVLIGELMSAVRNNPKLLVVQYRFVFLSIDVGILAVYILEHCHLPGAPHRFSLCSLISERKKK